MNEIMRDVWERQNFVVLDTETTGLRRPAEIIDFAVIETDGSTLFNTLIKPKVGISAFISDLTGITNEMVLDSPTWPEVKDIILHFLVGRDIVTYNATFDRHMMHCSDDMWGLGQADYHIDMQWFCAMEAYAPHGRLWNEYHQSWTWIKLGEALKQQGLPVTNTHRAYDDAMACWRLFEHFCKEG